MFPVGSEPGARDKSKFWPIAIPEDVVPAAVCAKESKLSRDAIPKDVTAARPKAAINAARTEYSNIEAAFLFFKNAILLSPGFKGTLSKNYYTLIYNRMF